MVPRRVRIDAAAALEAAAALDERIKSGWPAFNKCPAIGLPMIPKPANPIFSISLIFISVEAV